MILTVEQFNEPQKILLKPLLNVKRTHRNLLILKLVVFDGNRFCAQTNDFKIYCYFFFHKVKPLFQVVLWKPLLT